MHGQPWLSPNLAILKAYASSVITSGTGWRPHCIFPVNFKELSRQPFIVRIMSAYKETNIIIAIQLPNMHPCSTHWNIALQTRVTNHSYLYSDICYFRFIDVLDSSAVSAPDCLIFCESKGHGFESQLVRTFFFPFPVISACFVQLFCSNSFVHHMTDYKNEKKGRFFNTWY